METAQQFSDEEIMQGIQAVYEDWRGPGRFSFENIRNESDETMAMSREQYDRFLTELGSTRCWICGKDAELYGVRGLCDGCLESADRAIEDNAFDEQRKGY